MPLGLFGNLGNTTTGYSADYGGFGGSAYIGATYFTPGGAGTGAGTGAGAGTFVGTQQTAGGMFTVPGEPGVAYPAYGFNSQGVWGPVEQLYAPLATPTMPISISTAPAPVATGANTMPLNAMGQGYTSPGYTSPQPSVYTSPGYMPGTAYTTPATPGSSPVPTSIQVTPSQFTQPVPTYIQVSPNQFTQPVPTYIQVSPNQFTQPVPTYIQVSPNQFTTVPTSIAVTPENPAFTQPSATDIQSAILAGYTPSEWQAMTADQQAAALVQAGYVPVQTPTGGIAAGGSTPRPPSGGGSSGGSGGGAPKPSGGGTPTQQQQTPYKPPLISFGLDFGTPYRQPTPSPYPVAYSPSQFSALPISTKAAVLGLPLTTAATMSPTQLLAAAQQKGIITGAVTGITPTQFNAMTATQQQHALASAGYTPAQFNALTPTQKAQLLSQIPASTATGSGLFSSLFGSGQPVTDASGNPVLDANGNPVTSSGMGPVILIGGGLLLVLLLAKGKKAHA